MQAVSDFIMRYWLDILSTILGLIYIILEYRASIALWIVGIIMPAVDIILFWRHGLYADFGMAIYYTLAGIYGYLSWKFWSKKSLSPQNVRPISHYPVSAIPASILFFLSAWALIYYILITFTDSNVPISDSFINALSFIGLWALAKKYIQQWLIWIVVDVVSSLLYAYKGIPFKASLYALYALIAISGYLKWKQIMNNQTTS